MARTKLLPSRLSHHRTLWTAGGDSWLLEETAQQTTAQHTNKRYTAGLLFVQQLYLDADVFIIRHWRELIHPAGITPQGFLQTNTVLWLCSGKLKIVSDRNCLSKDVTASKYFNRGGGGSCTHASSCSSIHTQLQVQLTTHVLQDIQSKFIFTLIGHSFEPTKHVKWEAWELETPTANSDRCWTDR